MHRPHTKISSLHELWHTKQVSEVMSTKVGPLFLVAVREKLSSIFITTFGLDEEILIALSAVLSCTTGEIFGIVEEFFSATSSARQLLD